MNKISDQNRKGSVSAKGVVSSTLGTLFADAITYGAKKIAVPGSLPATKEDVAEIKRMLYNLQRW